MSEASDHDRGSQESKRITVRVDGGLYQDLQTALDASGITQSELVREGLRRAINARNVGDQPQAQDEQLDALRADLREAIDELDEEVHRLERLPLR